MKSNIKIIIAAFALLVSFAFITVNKVNSNSTVKANSHEEVETSHTEPMSGYAMEDKNQWD